LSRTLLLGFALAACAPLEERTVLEPPPAAPPSLDGPVVFVTREVFAGDYWDAGLICQSRGREAGLGGGFRAVLHDPLAALEVGDRAVQLDGTPTLELTDAGLVLLAPLELDEHGRLVEGGYWSPLDREGRPTASCWGGSWRSWSSTIGTGVIGSGRGTTWTHAMRVPCTERHALVCAARSISL
ncbi:MAG: hypothetical protein KC656_35550, partial [Myxococcales bacterium]|nr:hypothetical protein [Myxococcales bacterium]